MYIHLITGVLSLWLLSCQTSAAEENEQASAEIIQIPPVQPAPAITPVDTPLTQLSLTIGGITREGFLEPEGMASITSATEHGLSSEKLWRKMTTKIPLIEQWRDQYLSPKHTGQGTLLYPLAGADLLHADIFFPEVDTIIMIGLEPIGKIPESLRDLSGDNSRYFEHLRNSLNYVLNFSYFMTKSMSVDFTGKIDGTLSAILHFAVRRNYLISNINHVYIQSDGRLSTEAGDLPKGNCFTFLKDGKPKIVYYFALNLMDRPMTYGRRNIPGFTETAPAFHYLNNAGFSYTYVKAGSYLLHNRSFSTIRNLILSKAQLVLQDDTGIPLKYYDPARWHRDIFGVYHRPIDEFSGYLQADMKSLYQSGRPLPLPFGIGYLSRSGSSNLQLFLRKHGESPTSMPEEQAIPEPVTPLASALSGQYIIGCAAVKRQAAAEQLTQSLLASGLAAAYLYIPDYETGASPLYRVYVGPFTAAAEAEPELAKVRALMPNAYIFKMK
jgi:hypothetical protein